VNTLLLATLMYRSRLVPRAIAVIGLAGGPLIFLAAFGVLLGAWTQVSLTAQPGRFAGRAAARNGGWPLSSSCSEGGGPVVSGDSRLNSTQWRAACRRAAAALRYTLSVDLPAEQPHQVNAVLARIEKAVTSGSESDLRQATVMLDLLEPVRSATRLGEPPPGEPDQPAALRARQRIVELIYVLEPDSGPPAPPGLGPPRP
jgi:hypothetical protein